jgi:hypothetical protein
LAERIAARDRVFKEFGHTAEPKDGKCQCPYCIGDAEALAEMAAEYELRLHFETNRNAERIKGFEQEADRLTAERVAAESALDEARKARDVTEGVSLIAAERARQMSVEGWAPAHDDEHHRGELAVSAARYALHDTAVSNRIAWQWESCWWKPKDPIRNLVRAGALIAAEIDRRLRASPSPVPLDPPAQGTAKTTNDTRIGQPDVPPTQQHASTDTEG